MAIEFDGWEVSKGTIKTVLEAHDKRLDSIDDPKDGKLSELDKEIGAIKTQIARYSAFAVVIGVVLSTMLREVFARVLP